MCIHDSDVKITVREIYQKDSSRIYLWLKLDNGWVHDIKAIMFPSLNYIIYLGALEVYNNNECRVRSTGNDQTLPTPPHSHGKLSFTSNADKIYLNVISFSKTLLWFIMPGTFKLKPTTVLIIIFSTRIVFPHTSLNELNGYNNAICVFSKTNKNT